MHAYTHADHCILTHAREQDRYLRMLVYASPTSTRMFPQLLSMLPTTPVHSPVAQLLLPAWSAPRTLRVSDDAPVRLVCTSTIWYPIAQCEWPYLLHSPENSESKWRCSYLTSMHHKNKLTLPLYVRVAILLKYSQDTCLIVFRLYTHTYASHQQSDIAMHSASSHTS